MSELDSRKSDVVIGAIILAFCAFASWRTLLVSNPPTGTVAGPAFLPWVVIALSVVLGGMLIARAAFRSGQDISQEAVSMPARATLVRMGLFAALMIAYAAAFMSVGYLVSTWVAFVLGLVLFGERRLLVIALVPTLVTGFVYYAFTNFLNVWLP